MRPRCRYARRCRPRQARLVRCSTGAAPRCAGDASTVGLLRAGALARRPIRSGFPAPCRRPLRCGAGRPRRRRADRRRGAPKPASTASIPRCSTACFHVAAVAIGSVCRRATMGAVSARGCRSLCAGLALARRRQPLRSIAKLRAPERLARARRSTSRIETADGRTGRRPRRRALPARPGRDMFRQRFDPGLTAGIQVAGSGASSCLAAPKGIARWPLWLLFDDGPARRTRWRPRSGNRADATLRRRAGYRLRHAVARSGHDRPARRRRLRTVDDMAAEQGPLRGVVSLWPLPDAGHRRRGCPARSRRSVPNRRCC